MPRASLPTRARAAWGALALVVPLVAAAAPPQGGAPAAAPLDEAVQASLAMRPVGAIRVILRLADAPVLEDRRSTLAALPTAQRPGALAAALRGPFLERHAPLVERLRSIGGQDIQPLWLAHALALEMPRSRIAEVARWPGVERIETDVALRAMQLPRRASPHLARVQDEQVQAVLGRVPTAPVHDDGTPWQMPEHLAAIDAPRAWMAGLDGRGVTVAVVDTGVDLRVPALAAAWRGGVHDWLDPYGEHRLPHDAQGHGTLVASLMVGQRADGQPQAVAPRARLVAARLFDDAGHGRLSAVHRIYQWLLDPDGDERTADAAQIVNNSWAFAQSTDQCNLRLARIWQAYRLAGIPVVFAAGNDGPLPRTSMSPANNPGVISVGALDAAGQPARQSSRGPSACRDEAGATLPFPTLQAPGLALPALDRIGASLGVPQRADGTSFAAAVVSGALALMRQASPEAPIEQWLQALRLPDSDAAAPAAGISVHGAVARPATPAHRHAQWLELAEAGRLDEERLRAALPRGVGVVGLGGRAAPGHGHLRSLSPVALHWDAPAAESADADLELVLDDGTILPLQVRRRSAQATAAAAAATLVTGRRNMPVALDPALTADASDAPGERWTQPLRGGRVERDADGRWWYRPPAGFVGTDQFVRRDAQRGERIVKVLVRP